MQMLVNGKQQTSLWWKGNNPKSVFIIDQRQLPFNYIIEELKSIDDVYIAIKDMHLRGAPLIGGAAVWGIYLSCLSISDHDNFDEILLEHGTILKSARPTAVNLEYAINSVIKKIRNFKSIEDKIYNAKQLAIDFCKNEIESCRLIGEFGLPLIEDISVRKNGETVNILTHCNAGWLACIDYGTATSPIYLAHDKGIKVHVWVDETRPLNQGSRLTAWELGQHGIPHTIITDNMGGLLMQKGMVDMCIVGSDRTTKTGDVANKIGTYLKALAARDNNIPFYVALPSSTIDFSISDGLKDIIIEERDENEVLFTSGFFENNMITIRTSPDGSKALNIGFDITRAHLVSGLITERGICKATEEGIKKLFPENF